VSLIRNVFCRSESSRKNDDGGTRLAAHRKAAQRRGTLLAAFLAWEAGVRLFDVPGFLLPPPSELVLDFQDARLFSVSHGLHGCGRPSPASGFPWWIGALLSVAIVYSRFLERTLSPCW
jgi:ABC-type nitrate/sulfonate/bicarbonate transport system permease component